MKQDRQILIDKGKIWQVYNDGNSDDTLFEGTKTQCQKFIRDNNFGYYYKKGKIRIGKLIYENKPQTT